MEDPKKIETSEDGTKVVDSILGEVAPEPELLSEMRINESVDHFANAAASRLKNMGTNASNLYKHMSEDQRFLHISLLSEKMSSLFTAIAEHDDLKALNALTGLQSLVKETAAQFKLDL